MNSYKRPVISFHNLNFRFAVMIKQALLYGSRSVSTPSRSCWQTAQWRQPQDCQITLKYCFNIPIKCNPASYAATYNRNGVGWLEVRLKCQWIAIFYLCDHNFSLSLFEIGYIVKRDYF